MRRLVLAALLALAPAASAAAQGRMTDGGFVSEQVEWIEYHADTAGVAEGGRLVGSTFFLTNNQQGLLAFDVSQPEHPRKLGSLFLPHAAENEDPPSNGRILLLSQLGDVYHLSDGTTGQGSVLNVVDVRDPANMKVLASVDGAGDHTWDCLLDCTWAYSASGQILDLRDPARPKLLDRRWRDIFEDAVSPGWAHDVTEVSPGWVMVATTPFKLLDARDPANPKLVAEGPEDSVNTHHNVVWPRAMADRFVISATESQNLGRCETYGNAGLQVWDTRDWQRRGFEAKGAYYPANGTFQDGNPAVSATWYGCSAHWAETHPRFHDGGLVAGAFYSHGARIFEVDDRGELLERGWFLAHGAGTSAVYWITDRVLYVADDTRGLDVIKYTGPIPQRGPAPAPPAVRTPAPRAPLVDRRAPRVRITSRGVRCSEDCFGRVRVLRGKRRVYDRRVSLERGRTLRLRVRGRVKVTVDVVDRSGNRTRVTRKVVAR